MIDNYRHKGLRKKLVEQIRNKGIYDENVLGAINKVPRHLFVESGFVEQAYKDNAFPIAAGQTISQPYTVAFQTQLLDVKQDDRILEIGTGSGYQTAVLLEMGAQVFSIERQRELYAHTNQFLPTIGYYPRLYYGDGYAGLDAYAPFDKILITAGAPYIPEALKQQLRVGGILVAPIGGRYKQIMTSIIKVSETDFKQTDFGNFVFVPMLKGVEK